MTAEQDIVIPSPTVEPFNEESLLTCRSCGLTVGSPWSRFMAWFKGFTQNACKLRFCAGGKAPTDDKGIMNGIMFGEREAFNPCAGISEPHLHVTCNLCGYERLMRTKQRIAKGV